MKACCLNITLIVLFSTACLAQSYPNFTGVWELDISKSQIEAELVKSNESLFVKNIGQSLRTKFARKSESVQEMDLGQRLSSINQIHTYLIDRGLIEKQIGSGTRATRYTHEASSNKKTIKLKWTKTSKTNEGEFTIKTEENWILSDDGQTLTIKRKAEEFGSNNSLTLVYAKVKFSAPNLETKQISEELGENFLPNRSPNFPIRIKN